MKRYLTVRSIVALTTAVVAAGVVGFAASSEGDPASPVGQPPPEWAANTWPAHNHDLSNTRATSQSPINSQTVSQLKVKWSFPLKGAGEFGLFSSTPIVVNGTVYFQDLNSNVFALDRNTGALKWEHKFNRPSVGPNGVSFGYGRLYAATETQAFALDPQTGHLIWKSRKLPRNGNEGIDMTPQLYDGTVLISTIPGNVKSFYKGKEDVPLAVELRDGDPVSELFQAGEAATSGAAVVVVVWACSRTRRTARSRPTALASVARVL